MVSRHEMQSVLIEVAAQHPLIDRTRPNDEFAARLARGVELAHTFKGAGLVVEVYVPGSRHMHHGVSDHISLSSAGTAYLVDAGLPRSMLHGDDLNDRYKGDAGVYGSADECFVAASYFKDNNFGALASVVSPVQLMRKMLHYIEFGVLPLAYTAPTESTHHSYIEEIFEAIPYVLAVDHDLQGPESIMAQKLRYERKPK